METATQSAIEKIQDQIRALEEQIEMKKKAINIFCDIEGEAPMYADVGADRAKPLAAFRSDQFFGRPMATAAREILEQRATRNFGAISLEELYDTMKSGGFDFENKNDQIAKRNLAITLSKNLAFMRVPSNGYWGLSAWYPNVKRKREKSHTNGTEDAIEKRQE